MGRPRILVVEDDYLTAETIGEMLEEQGFSVEGKAGTVRQALAILVHRTFDAVLLDYNLGHETSDRIVDLLAERGIPVVFISGLGRSFLPERYRSARVVTKPVDGERLAAELRAVLA